MRLQKVFGMRNISGSVLNTKYISKYQFSVDKQTECKNDTNNNETKQETKNDTIMDEVSSLYGIIKNGFTNIFKSNNNNNNNNNNSESDEFKEKYLELMNNNKFDLKIEFQQNWYEYMEFEKLRFDKYGGFMKKMDDKILDGLFKQTNLNRYEFLCGCYDAFIFVFNLLQHKDINELINNKNIMDDEVFNELINMDNNDLNKKGYDIIQNGYTLHKVQTYVTGAGTVIPKIDISSHSVNTSYKVRYYYELIKNNNENENDKRNYIQKRVDMTWNFTLEQKIDGSMDISYKGFVIQKITDTLILFDGRDN